MKLCSDFFFCDFHVIGIEVIGTTMSSFENKKAVYRMLFVHSKLENMGEKKLLILFSFIYVLSMKSEPN